MAEKLLKKHILITTSDNKKVQAIMQANGLIDQSSAIRLAIRQHKVVQ